MKEQLKLNDGKTFESQEALNEYLEIFEEDLMDTLEDRELKKLAYEEFRIEREREENSRNR